MFLDRRINNCPVLVCDHHAERDGYFEIATVIDSPILASSRLSIRPPRPADNGLLDGAGRPAYNSRLAESRRDGPAGLFRWRLALRDFLS